MILIMYIKVLKVFVFLLCLTKYDLAGASRKFVHQRDISERCRRRVVPSVFLGQHVMDASSQLMQFSQLEVPYSCSLSVRAEAGSNIIMVIELLSEDSLTDACTISGDQLIVYELGETFGGYWGPIPKGIMRNSVKNYTQYYTLKTTRPSTTRYRPQKTQSTTEKILKQTETQSTVKEQEYYTMDVPIVNVSGNFQLGPPREAHDSEDLFNYIYDVTPRNGVEYEISIMPLVQFSIRQQTGSYGGENRLYELDYESKGFTMDPRLTFHTVKNKKISLKSDWKANKRFRHKPKSTAILRRRDYKKMFSVLPPYNNETVTPLIPTLDLNYYTNSWELINSIIKSINITTARSTVFQNETFDNILHRISNSQHNSSVYMARNISQFNLNISIKENDTIFQDETNSNSTVLEIKPSTIAMATSSLQQEQKTTQTAVDLNELKSDYGLRSKSYITHTHGTLNLEGIKKDESNMTIDKINGNTSAQSSSSNSTKTTYRTGALVDHESWENIVQAAPVMAVVLNNTESLNNNTITEVNSSKHKRHIKSLEIDQSRPRNLTTKPALVTDTPPFDDIHDMAKMVELEDDEIGGRAALRYLRQYVGPALYNMCDHGDRSLRQILLFNSSRIVIAVSNFTIDRMLLVLTPAQTLLSGVSQCPQDKLECQIVGTRVCIDSLNACDGVPNCGSYEIYDEDRLTCGTTHGMQGSVFLAALTFLAVILTAAYIILYWLERCVPRVSDAFFVYSDSAENELFLDSIMRSPHDDEDPSYKMNYPVQFFDDDVLYQDLKAEERKAHFFKKIFNICWRFLCFRRISIETPSEKLTPENQLSIKEPSRMFSFTQLELMKFGKVEFKDEEVQTRDSFEMPELNFLQNKKEPNSLSSLINFRRIEYSQDSRRHDSELNLLKLSKSRSLSSQSNSISNTNSIKRRATVTDGELEIKNIVYENVITPTSKIPVICEVHAETKRTGGSKRLRFDDELKMISTIDEDDDNLPASSSTIQRLNNKDLDEILKVEDIEGSGIDFMRFWGAKGKKGKKKKLKPLP